MDRRTRLGDGLAFVLPALLAICCGWQAHARGLVDLETLAAARNAWEVFYLQAHANLALIGFDQPPLLALLHLPAAAFTPGLLAGGLIGPLLGAVFLGLSTLVLVRLGRALQLPGWALLLTAGLFAGHPLLLGWAALGSRAMPLVFTLLGLAASLILWAKTERLRDLVTGGLLAAAAILLVYEALMVVLAAAIFIGWRCRRSTGASANKAEGMLLAFLLPAVYAATLWILTDWIIMGDLGHFWRVTMIPALTVGREVNRDWLQPLLKVVIITNPLVLGLIYAHLRRSQAPPAGIPAAGMMVAGLLAPSVFMTLRPVAEDSSYWTALMPVAAAISGIGAALLLAFLADLWQAGTDWRRVVSPGLVIILIGSLLLAYDTQMSRRGLPVGIRSVLKGHPAFAAEIMQEEKLAAQLHDHLNTNFIHILAGPRAFVVALKVRSGPGVVILKESAPPVDVHELGLTAESRLVIWDPHGQVIKRWQRALPHLKLVLLQSLEDWHCYELQAGQPVDSRL